MLIYSLEFVLTYREKLVLYVVHEERIANNVSSYYFYINYFGNSGTFNVLTYYRLLGARSTNLSIYQ